MFAKLATYNIFLLRHAMCFNDISATFILSHTIVSDLLLMLPEEIKTANFMTIYQNDAQHYNIEIIQSRLGTNYSSLVEADPSLGRRQN